MDLTSLQWTLALTAAFFVGLNKAGITGIDVMLVTLLIFVFGGRASTGILMPLLIFGDLMAVKYYHQHAQWKYLLRLLPWMIAGVVTGVYVGKDLPEETFRQWMSAIILLTTIMLFWWNNKPDRAVPDNRLFAGSMGFAAGFTTMVGNLAGAFSNIFFIATRLPKQEFIGTASWLFCIINLVKLPFHLFVWKTITPETLQVDLKLLPAIILGFVLGVTAIKKTPDALFRRMILVLTAIGAVILFFR